MYRNLNILPLSIAFVAASLISAAAATLTREQVLSVDLRLFVVDDSGLYYGIQADQNLLAAESAN